MLERNSHLQSEGPSGQKKKKKRGRLMFSSKRALERSKMRPPKLKSRVKDAHECTRMTLDFGDNDVADLASSQDMLTYRNMKDQVESQQDIISEDEQEWQHVSCILHCNICSLRYAFMSLNEV
jgi:hypothetical protein